MHTVNNARITLLATALNNLGVGSILAGIVTPLVNGTMWDFFHLMTGVIWVLLGVDLIFMAQVVLGRLRT